MLSKSRTRTHDERARPAFGESREGRLEVAVAASFRDGELPPERACCCNHVLQHALAHHRSKIGKIGNRCCLRYQLAEEIKPLGHQLDGEERHSGDIAARPAEAGDQAELDRIATEHQHDRYRRGRGLCRQCRRKAAACDDRGHLTSDQICRQFRQSIVFIIPPAVFDGDVLALDVAGFFQALSECGRDVRIRIRRASMHEPDNRHRRLLCVRRERPCRHRAAEQRDEGTSVRLVELHPLPLAGTTA